MPSGIQEQIAQWKHAAEDGTPLEPWQERVIADEAHFEALRVAEKATLPGQIKATVHEINAGLKRLTALLERL